jgi:hypothetical protein
MTLCTDNYQYKVSYNLPIIIYIRDVSFFLVVTMEMASEKFSVVPSVTVLYNYIQFKINAKEKQLTHTHTYTHVYMHIYVINLFNSYLEANDKAYFSIL